MLGLVPLRVILWVFGVVVRLQERLPGVAVLPDEEAQGSKLSVPPPGFAEDILERRLDLDRPWWSGTPQVDWMLST